jgi:hypothetical protein
MSRRRLACLLALAALAIPGVARAQVTVEEPAQVPAEDQAQLSGQQPDSLSGTIPAADALYDRIVEGAAADTLPPGEGIIVYRGIRLVFYPKSEIIVLEGQAAAEQGGTKLAARRILYRSREGVVEAFGGATVSRGPSQLGADSLFYDRETGVVATFGLSVLTEGQSETKGINLRYDFERRSGLLGAGVTTYDPWVLQGDQMTKIGAGTYLVDEGHFTTCELEDPHYRFVSDEIKLRRDDVIVASPVVLYFSDIPVFYLPWYVEPVTRGRRSGFLRPQIGINTLLFGSGRERNLQDVGFYYVFGDYADALLAADWYTESRFIVRANARYNVRYSFQGDAYVEQVWNRLDNSESRLVRFRHDHTLGRDSRAGVDVNWSNSRSFLRRNSFDPDEILQRSFRSSANYSTRFGWGSLVAGSDADFRLDVNRTDYRLADLRISINQRPLWGRSVPVAGQQAADRRWWQSLQYSASASGVARLSQAQVDSAGNPLSQIPIDSLTGQPIEGERETVVNEQQGRLQLTLNGPLNLFGILQTTPSMSFNATVDNDALAEPDSVTREVEKLGGQSQLNTGLSMSSRFFRIFRRPIGPFVAMRHTVAPSLSISYSPKPSFWGSADEARRRTEETLNANLSLTQDLDVKMPLRRDRDEEEDGGEEERQQAEAAADTTAEEAGPDEEGDQRPETATRTVNLLNVTNSLGFDVIRHREAGKIGFRDLSTRLSSGLGESFNLSTTLGHDLVKIDPEDQTETFDPFLARITTDFSIRRGGGVSTRRPLREDAFAGRGAEDEVEEAREDLAAEGSGFGPWSLNLTHSWTRDRQGLSNRQSMGIGAQLLPSTAWSLNYQTNYDITESKFQGQTLSLVRQLHDWTAALNVNFFPSEPQDRILVTFTVFLTEAPDLEVPYRIRRE